MQEGTVVGRAVTQPGCKRQQDMKGGAGETVRIVTRRLDPDLAAVHIDDPLGDGEPEPCPFSLESDLAARVLLDVAHLVELLEDANLVLAVDADTGIGDGYFQKEMVLAPRSRSHGAGDAAQKVLGRSAYG